MVWYQLYTRTAYRGMPSYDVVASICQALPRSRACTSSGALEMGRGAEAEWDAELERPERPLGGWSSGSSGPTATATGPSGAPHCRRRRGDPPSPLIQSGAGVVVAGAHLSEPEQAVPSVSKCGRDLPVDMGVCGQTV